METGDPYFKFSVETKDELEKLLEISAEITHPEGVVERPGQGRFTTQPCTKGCKIIAKVVFRNVDDVKKIIESERKHVFVGSQLARLSKIDLASLLEDGKADFVDVPYNFYNGKRKSSRQREAFIYFKSEEDRAATMAVPTKIGEQGVYWGDSSEKRCRQCHKLGHIMRKCEIYKMSETKAHDRFY
ncbi:hypothetical protein BGX26_002294 [Mortierella sp. AD094]|nr:hypothetical protein BGX26_002294 [Mortierella sp. AD094]